MLHSILYSVDVVDRSSWRMVRTFATSSFTSIENAVIFLHDACSHHPSSSSSNATLDDGRATHGVLHASKNHPKKRPQKSISLDLARTYLPTQDSDGCLLDFEITNEQD
jgi:hypothetical protein